MCPAGTFSNTPTNNTECTKCPIGQFSSQPGSLNCTFCEPGSFALSPGNKFCGKCEPGEYSGLDSSGIVGCIPSPIGTYTAISGSTSYTLCPRNMTTIAIGSSSTSDCICKAGMYKDPYGFCVECTPGSTSPINSGGFDTCSCGSSGVYKSQDISSW
jgi:hypothetical protein